mmetsp:Transcript_10919/g.16873  ORF Transcript_10919/g.16873 Transcript_10919/m.16873 type:complete len:277 (-) Transcript_10919:180-1010(-)
MSFAGLDHSFLWGAAAGAVGVGICIPLTTWCTSLFPALQDRVHALPEKDLMNFKTLGHSTLHAVVQIVGTYSFLYSSVGQATVTNEPSGGFDSELWVTYGVTGFGPEFYMGVFVGYLIADAWYLGVEKLGPLFTAHHYAAAACWTMNAYLHSMQRLACQLQFCELSTILMNLRQLLLTAGYESSSTLLTVVTLLFFVAFGLVRVATLPSILGQWMKQGEFQMIWEHNGAGPALATSFFIAVHTFLQTFWFSLMVRKLMKLVLGGSKKQKKTPPKEE